MLHHHFMHVDHELVEFMPVDEQDYEEVGAWSPSLDGDLDT